MAKKICAVLLTMGLLLLFLAGCGGKAIGTGGTDTKVAYEVTDIQGNVTQMPAKPQHILTLSLGTDEIMLGLVEPERMAAVNKLLDDPLNSNITELASTFEHKIGNPSVEELAALQPDLVIFPAWGDVAKAEALRDLGIKVVVCHGARSINEIKENIRLLARAAGEEERGRILLEQMEAKLADIEQKTAQIPAAERKSVVLISVMSTYGGSDCTFDDACRLAGVVNGRAVAGISSGQPMSKEQLVRIDPDLLFLPTYTNHGTFDVDAFRRSYLEDPSLQMMKAIRAKALREPRESYIYNDSQDIVFGVQEIACMAYGESFSQPDGQHLTAVAP